TLTEYNAVIHQLEFKLELAKLEIRKLKLLVEHEYLIMSISMNSSQNIACDFKKKITAKSSKLLFKLDVNNSDDFTKLKQKKKIDDTIIRKTESIEFSVKTSS